MKRYEYHERCDKFEDALHRMEEKIADPNLAAAFHILVWFEGTYFRYGHGYDKWYTAMCRKAARAPKATLNRLLNNVARMASRYKICDLDNFDNYGNWKSKALEQKYMKRLPIG